MLTIAACHPVPVPPTSLLLSSLVYTPPTPAANTVVGTLSATDGNVNDAFSYSVTGGANASLFTVLPGTAQLVLVNAGQTGNGLAVVVTVTDSNNFSLQQAFTISEGGPVRSLLGQLCSGL